MEKKMNARLVSLNILTHELFGRNYPLFGDQTPEDYTFEKRMHRFISLIDYAKPDVIMLQELSGPKYWGTALELEAMDSSKALYTSKHFPNYVWVNEGNRYGVPYADNQTKRNAFDAHNMTMYNTEKFDLVAYGTFFLTDDGTRETSWYEMGSARIQIFDDIGDCTWMVLADKETGIKAVYATTHSYVGSLQRNAYHVEQLGIMTDTLGKIAEKYGCADKALPIIVAGDFNISPKRRNVGHSYEHMVKYAKYDDAKVVAPISDESGTARVYGCDMGGHDGTTKDGERIDFFFSQGMDINKYTVLGGLFKPVDEKNYEYIHEPVFDGSMYDLSDHQPIYCEITVGEGEKYASHHVSPSEFYSNPNTSTDDVITEGYDESPVVNLTLKFEQRRILAFTGGGHNIPTESALVNDKEKGTVLRFAAKKAANLFKGVIAAAGIFDRYGAEMSEEEKTKLANAKKLVLTYKTELSIEGIDLNFFVLSEDAKGEGQYKLTRLPVDKNGEWRTLEIDISNITGRITRLGIFGNSNATGLLRGDAVYIESIDFV